MLDGAGMIARRAMRRSVYFLLSTDRHEGEGYMFSLVCAFFLVGLHRGVLAIASCRLKEGLHARGRRRYCSS